MAVFLSAKLSILLGFRSGWRNFRLNHWHAERVLPILICFLYTVCCDLRLDGGKMACGVSPQRAAGSIWVHC